jgi:hypothetical protein
LNTCGCCDGDDQRERQLEYEDPDERQQRNSEHRRVLDDPLSDAQNRARHHGDNCGGDSGEQPLDPGEVAVGSEQDAQGHDRQKPRKDEQRSGEHSPTRPAQQPTQVGGQLLCFGARQQHAVVQCVEKTSLADPLTSHHDLVVHHRDLASGTPKTIRGHCYPGR